MKMPWTSPIPPGLRNGMFVIALDGTRQEKIRG